MAPWACSLGQLTAESRLLRRTGSRLRPAYQTLRFLRSIRARRPRSRSGTDWPFSGTQLGQTAIQEPQPRLDHQDAVTVHQHALTDRHPTHLDHQQASRVTLPEVSTPKAQGEHKLAVLMDAENVSVLHIPQLLTEVAKYGDACVRRLYGNWAELGLGWRTTTADFSFQTIQCSPHSSFKSSVDGTLIVDAMELLHSGRFSAFCLVTGDNDFASLASRIREHGVKVFGFGLGGQTGSVLKAMCNEYTHFHDVGRLRPMTPIGTAKLKSVPGSEVAPTNPVSYKDAVLLIQPVLAALRRAKIRGASDRNGWVELRAVRKYMSFDPLSASLLAYSREELLSLLAASKLLHIRSPSVGAAFGGRVLVRLASNRPWTSHTADVTGDGGAAEAASALVENASGAQAQLEQTGTEMHSGRTGVEVKEGQGEMEVDQGDELVNHSEHDKAEDEVEGLILKNRTPTLQPQELVAALAAAVKDTPSSNGGWVQFEALVQQLQLLSGDSPNCYSNINIYDSVEGSGLFEWGRSTQFDRFIRLRRQEEPSSVGAHDPPETSEDVQSGKPFPRIVPSKAVDESVRDAVAAAVFNAPKDSSGWSSAFEVNQCLEKDFAIYFFEYIPGMFGGFNKFLQRLGTVEVMRTGSIGRGRYLVRLQDSDSAISGRPKKEMHQNKVGDLADPASAVESEQSSPRTLAAIGEGSESRKNLPQWVVEAVRTAVLRCESSEGGSVPREDVLRELRANFPYLVKYARNFRSFKDFLTATDILEWETEATVRLKPDPVISKHKGNSPQELRATLAAAVPPENERVRLKTAATKSEASEPTSGLSTRQAQPFGAYSVEDMKQTMGPTTHASVTEGHHASDQLLEDAELHLADGEQYPLSEDSDGSAHDFWRHNFSPLTPLSSVASDTAYTEPAQEASETATDEWQEDWAGDYGMHQSQSEAPKLESEMHELDAVQRAMGSLAVEDDKHVGGHDAMNDQKAQIEAASQTDSKLGSQGSERDEQVDPTQEPHNKADQEDTSAERPQSDKSHQTIPADEGNPAPDKQKVEEASEQNPEDRR